MVDGVGAGSGVVADTGVAVGVWSGVAGVAGVRVVREDRETAATTFMEPGLLWGRWWEGDIGIWAVRGGTLRHASDWRGGAGGGGG